MDDVFPPHVAAKLLACAATSKRLYWRHRYPARSQQSHLQQPQLFVKTIWAKLWVQVTGPAETQVVWSGWYSFCIFALPKWRLQTGSCVPVRKREKKRQLLSKQNVKAQCSKPQTDFWGSACWKHKNNNTNFPKCIRSQKPPKESGEQVSAMEPTEMNYVHHHRSGVQARYLTRAFLCGGQGRRTASN